MNLVLLGILFLVMILVGGKRGVKTFFSLVLNFLVLITCFYFIALGFNPVIISLISCLIISLIILYYVNGTNIKTRASYKSIIIVLVILILSIFIISNNTRIGGFGYEDYEEINMFSYDINLNMQLVTTSLIILGLIGAIVDSSIAITSALYEVYDNNKHLSKKELFLSGLNIGKDILGTTTNTLLFAFLAEFMTLLIWFISLKYSFLDIINSKVFAKEFIKILFSAIGCVIVIPISSYMCASDIKRKKIVKE